VAHRGEVYIEDGGEGIAVMIRYGRPHRRLVPNGSHLQYCPHQSQRYTNPRVGCRKYMIISFKE